MAFNPRDFLSLEDAVAQSQRAQAGPAAPPPRPSPFVGNEAYSTTVMPETGEPGPNRSLAGNINFATPQTAQQYGQRYGARVVTANSAGGPTKRNVDEYGLDFGMGDVLNAGVIASRENGNYDKWYDAVNPATGMSNRDKALQDELTQGARYGWGAQNNGQLTQRSPQMFGAGPQYQFSPVAGQDYRPANGRSPLLSAGAPRSGAASMAGAQAAPRRTATMQSAAPQSSALYGQRGATQAPRQSMYGGRQQPTFGAPIQSGRIA